MKKYMKNKHGDITVMILVIGVFAICTLAILSFIISESKEVKNPLGTELFEEIHSDVEKFYFYSNILSKEIAANEIDATLEGNQLIIERQVLIPKSKIQIISTSQPPLISVKYVKNLNN